MCNTIRININLIAFQNSRHSISDIKFKIKMKIYIFFLLSLSAVIVSSNDDFDFDDDLGNTVQIVNHKQTPDNSNSNDIDSLRKGKSLTLRILRKRKSK